MVPQSLNSIPKYMVGYAEKVHCLICKFKIGQTPQPKIDKVLVSIFAKIWSLNNDKQDFSHSGRKEMCQYA